MMEWIDWLALWAVKLCGLVGALAMMFFVSEKCWDVAFRALNVHKLCWYYVFHHKQINKWIRRKYPDEDFKTNERTPNA